MANGLSRRAQGIADGTWHTQPTQPAKETKRTYTPKKKEDPAPEYETSEED